MSSPEYQKEWYLKNRVKVLSRVKSYYEENKEKVRAYKKEYRVLNRDELRGVCKKFHSDNPNYNRDYAKSHPLFYKTHNNNRRLGLKGLTVKVVQMVYEDNIKKYGTLTCYLCEQPIVFGKDQLEHKHPISRGGKSEYCNLAVACEKCNHNKYNRTEEEYRILCQTKP